MTYRVSVTDTKMETATPVVILYSGVNYQDAFDAAVAARSVMEFRGKWVKFSDGWLGVAKWARIS